MSVKNILCQTKRWFAFSKIGFCADTNVFEEALNAVKFLGWLKKFGEAQNILGPVKGQGIRVHYMLCMSKQKHKKQFNVLKMHWTLVVFSHWTCNAMNNLSSYKNEFFWQKFTCIIYLFSISVLNKRKCAWVDEIKITLLNPATVSSVGVNSDSIFI